MGFIGGKGVLVLEDPGKKHPDSIEKGDHDDADGNSRGSMNGIRASEGYVEFIELDGHYGDDIPQHQRPGIAHEDLVLTTEDIIDKECEQGSHQAD